MLLSKRGRRRARRVSAGHRRALRYLSAHIARWRCPNCLADAKRPPVYASGIVCPYCGETDPRYRIDIEPMPIRGGFRWTAYATFIEKEYRHA